MVGSRMPLLAAVTMGYGHLRAAWALAERLGVEVVAVDRPEVAGAREARFWSRYRIGYELLSRLSQGRRLGWPFRALLERLTAIAPLIPGADLATADAASRRLRRLADQGLCQQLLDRVENEGRGLLTTFYAPAIAADRRRLSPVHCVVTDTEVHRVWVAAAAAASRVRYLVPSEETAARLAAYGVRETDIRCTGFPLPPRLTVGVGDGLPDHATARLARLRPTPGGTSTRALTIAFSVGGAGAQAERATELLAELAPEIASGVVRLVLVAGLRPRLARRFRERAAGLAGVEVLDAPDFATYYRRFNRALESVDVLWSKPSELVFYGALGLPLVLDAPVGAHERANARWILDAGAALGRPAPGSVAVTLARWSADGSLHQAARAGLERLPRHGADAIAAAVLDGS